MTDSNDPWKTPEAIRPPGIYMKDANGKEFRLNRAQRRLAFKGKIRLTRKTKNQPVLPSSPADGEPVQGMENPSGSCENKVLKQNDI